MRVSDFDFELPAGQIAQRPLPNRGDSRLLHLGRSSGTPGHSWFRDLPQFLQSGDLMVFNNTRVIAARLYGNKATGGRIEILVERLLDDGQARVQIRASKPPPAGTELIVAGVHLRVLGREGSFFIVESPRPWLQLMDSHGAMPLPPYIERDAEQQDRQRYQTVFASVDGAVAAPTAGLHFDDRMLEQLSGQGIGRAELTLHVGAGTFQPVRVDEVEAHQMHAEWCDVGPALCDAVAETRRNGGRVIAVGTTALRALESAAVDGALQPRQGDTSIFIYPGYQFQVVDGLLTNFHLPRSSLLMLVSALAGRERILAAYAEAVREGYRFFSYGDAMLILDGAGQLY